MGPDRGQPASGALPWEAFQSSVVTENFGKRIQALEVWNEQLLAGLVDGTLVVFAPPQPPADPCGPWQVKPSLLQNLRQRRNHGICVSGNLDLVLRI